LACGSRQNAVSKHATVTVTASDSTVPHLVSQIYVYLKDKLESVQRRFTKRLNGFGHISYAARPDRLKAETLELKRLKPDLTRMFSIIRRFVDIDCNSLFHVIDCESVYTRAHNLGLYKQHCNVNCRLNAFVCRNINVWNRLPARVVNSDSVAVFKHTLACVNFS